MTRASLHTEFTPKKRFIDSGRQGARRVWKGGVVEGGKGDGWQEAAAKFRAPSSQDLPVAERTGGTVGDSAACLGAGVSGGAADPDLDLGGPRRGGEAADEVYYRLVR